MPGAMHRMGVYLGLVEDADYEGEADYEGGSAERAPARRADHYPRADMTTGGGYDQPTEYGYAAADGSTGYADRAEGAASPGYQITTLHPRTYNEARTIGEHFRKNTPVIMNLSEMDDADAKRLVDFAAGLTFGLRGRIERVTAKVFLLSPHNVQVTAQDKARIAENGFFNQS
jgi:cell division inhibitor SepF